LARFDQVEPQDIVGVYGEQSDAGKADAVAALATRILPAKSDPLLRAVVSDAPEFAFVSASILGAE
jgi:hypothetical protein